MRTIGFVLASLMFMELAGCEESGSPSGSATEREIVATDWSVDWLVGSSPNDTLLMQPWRIAATDQTVYVADKAGARVAAFSVEDGALRWIVGGRGSGPGEFRLPTALAVAPNGEVWVSDADNPRVTLISPTGHVVGDFTIDEGWYVEALCPLANGTMLAVVNDPKDALYRFNRDGEIVARHSFPWKDLQDAPSLLRQSFLAAGEGGACTLALGLGRGFADYDGRQFTYTHPYVEDVQLPEVISTISDDGSRRSYRLSSPGGAALAVTRSDDTLIVAFAGESGHRGRVLDLYRAKDGAYLSSLLLPWSVHHGGMARRGDRYFFISQTEGLPILLSARPEATN